MALIIKTAPGFNNTVNIFTDALIYLLYAQYLYDLIKYAIAVESYS